MRLPFTSVIWLSKFEASVRNDVRSSAAQGKAAHPENAALTVRYARDLWRFWIEGLVAALISFVVILLFLTRPFFPRWLTPFAAGLLISWLASAVIVTPKLFKRLKEAQRVNQLASGSEPST